MAVAIVPIVGAMGLAVDYASLTGIRSEMQHAADSAVLGAAAEFGASDRERKKLANKLYKANFDRPSDAKRVRGKLEILEDGYRYSASLKVPTILIQVLGQEWTKVAVTAEVSKSSDNAEVALVVDTTGSMGPHMATMKDAAKKFIDIIYDASAGNVKTAVVPFVASVNVGRQLSNFELDRAGDSQFHASSHENQVTFFDWENDCGAPNHKDGPSTEEKASLFESGKRALAHVIQELFGVKAASAQSTGAHIDSFPDGWTSTGPCSYYTPPKLNHFDFFADTGIRWKGCVEARPGSMDVSDDPAGSDPDSKWVPYFWPEEEPRGTPAVTHNHYFDDNYLDTMPLEEGKLRRYQWWATRNIIKYDGSFSFNIDNSAPDTLGPNKSCPDELLPLTNDRNTVKAKISGLNFWNDGGTIASEGVAWGMRALTPGAPLRQGSASKEIKKILVLFGDGKNSMPVNIDNSHMFTDYGAYGYLRWGRLSAEGLYGEVLSAESGPARVAKIQEVSQRFLDERTRLACENARDEDITVLTILFNETDAATRQLYADCASDGKVVIAANPAQLEDAFQEVANKILKVYLRR